MMDADAERVVLDWVLQGSSNSGLGPASSTNLSVSFENG